MTPKDKSEVEELLQKWIATEELKFDYHIRMIDQRVCQIEEIERLLVNAKECNHKFVKRSSPDRESLHYFCDRCRLYLETTD